MPTYPWKNRGESTFHSLLINPNTREDVVVELCKSHDPEVQMAAQFPFGEVARLR